MWVCSSFQHFLTVVVNNKLGGNVTTQRKALARRLCIKVLVMFAELNKQTKNEALLR